MKKAISAATALIMAAAVSCTAFAESTAANDETPITVNGRRVVFYEDQSPVIQDDRLYVPVRRVLEMMGETVKWNDETKTVTVDSYDNLTRVNLTIDNKEIEKYTFTSVLYAEKEIINSDVAPVIINDRTMLPIRVVAEALGARVDWNDELRSTAITTKEKLSYANSLGADVKADDFDYAEAVKAENPKLVISADAPEGGIKEGDTVTVRVALKDIDKVYPEAKVVSGAISVEYNMDNFQYSGFKTVEKGVEVKPFTGADNPSLYDKLAKVVFVNSMTEGMELDEDGVFAELTFTALNALGGEFVLANGVSSFGNDTELLVTVDPENNYVLLASTELLYIDQTPVVIE